MHLFLQSIWCYPLKSAQGIALTDTTLDAFGVQHDRRWMLVDDAGVFVTQRQSSLMGGLRAEAIDHTLRIDWQGQSVTAIANAEDCIAVNVWADQVQGWGVAESVNQQLSAWLGRSVRLVYCPDNAQRAVDPHYAPAGTLTAFSDGFPLLLISQASLDALSAAWGTAIDVRRFRPNVVVGGDCAPFAEDQWRRIQIGQVVLDVVKPCSRCVIPSFEPDRQQATAGFLRFLARHRQHADGKIYVGQNVIVRGVLAPHGGLVQTDAPTLGEQQPVQRLNIGQSITVLA